MERDTFEHQLFSWENWDEMDTNDLQFYDVTLKVQVGEHAVGTEFPVAFILGSQSMLVLMNEEDEEFAYDLKVSVGDKLEPPTHQHDGCGCGHEH